ncbi:TRAP dicarboxylate transporter, DctP subunit [Clostridium aceticum]|uniref:TRAP dicarboxylate transporter, DctP subunit n=1 Tax=Clostridium aceticum TaxID=84022 RepID=A0A0D8I6I3_9CLOT|nr:TRAP transporter substrate-binding protein [Clostridium aceticum]AKL93805.1 TRAP dicarboxylate transporter, DctP subunit [Clostridium aceticum]KJF25833.1 C4-dicarboxylate ABC transporter substrate-binding protein [Clostridium aceticum]
MKKKLSLLLCMVLVVSLLAACGQKEPAPAAGGEDVAFEGVKYRLAHVVNENDSFHIAAEKFKALVEERTEGKVEIELHPNATLGDERTLLEGMQMGTIDMGVITNGPIANFVPEVAVFELPFLFSNREEAYGVLDGTVGKEILKKMEDVNLKGLAFAERGFRNLTNSKRAVATPNDMQGLRIRVMENPVYIDTFQALGANTVPMAWTETLTALQQGTIDGQENPVVVIHSFKLDETQKHLSLSRHTYSPATIMMSLKEFNKLPADIQEIIEKSAQEAAEYARAVNTESEEVQLQELIERGMEITEVDVEAFQAAVSSVYDKYRNQYGEYMDKIQAELNK